MNHNQNITASNMNTSPLALVLRITALACVVMAAHSPVSAGTDKDTVRWDDRAGQWVYTLFNPADLSRSKEVRYTPRTLIEPLVKSSVRWDKNLFEYRYRIANGADARQPISSVSVRAPKWDAEAIKHAPLRPGMTGPEIQVVARAEVAVEEAFVAKTLYSPNQWKPFLNVKRPTRVVFGWLVNYEKDYAGIAPRTSQSGFSVLRTELPGAGWMELQGDTPDIYEAATLPRSGAVADQVSQVLAEDSVFVAAMVPAIVVPKPYDSAELARRIKAHVATWPDAGLMTSSGFTALDLKLDKLTNALSINDKKTAKAAVADIIAEARGHHPGMANGNTDDDDDAHDSKSDKRKLLSERGALVEITEPTQLIHRVAVRALVFDLGYLMARIEERP
jgi:hypothetical protein